MFDKLASDWLAQVLPMHEHSTQKNHRHILTKHLLPRFGETPRRSGYEGRFSTPKTAAGVRRIPLSVAMRHLVGEWRNRAKRTAPDDLVFSTWLGKPISPNNVLRSAVFPACTRLGLPRVT
jgi:hypothetical protein